MLGEETPCRPVGGGPRTRPRSHHRDAAARPGLPRMPTPKAPGTEFLRGYKLLEPLAPLGPGDLWKCSGPDGRVKAARFLPGDARDLAVLRPLLGARHHAQLALDRAELIGDKLVVLRDPADRTLNDVLVEYRAAGRPGIP